METQAQNGTQDTAEIVRQARAALLMHRSRSGRRSTASSYRISPAGTNPPPVASASVRDGRPRSVRQG